MPSVWFRYCCVGQPNRELGKSLGESAQSRFPLGGLTHIHRPAIGNGRPCIQYGEPVRSERCYFGRYAPSRLGGLPALAHAGHRPRLVKSSLRKTLSQLLHCAVPRSFSMAVTSTIDEPDVISAEFLPLP